MFWEKLSEGGEKGQCGWLTDRFGVSWQVVPTTLMELMSDPDTEKAGRVTQAMLKMTKIEIEPLRQAYEQR
jgi:predicted 3-demethylubiquinone-9 3-methyltransferase (glyoxalase superfamily)